MCNCYLKLRKAQYELDQQRGRGVIDLGRLRDMLDAEPCDCQKEAA